MSYYLRSLSRFSFCASSNISTRPLYSIYCIRPPVVQSQAFASRSHLPSQISSQDSRSTSQPLKSGSETLLIPAGLLLVAIFAFLTLGSDQQTVKDLWESSSYREAPSKEEQLIQDTMAKELPGRVSTLTPEQEAKLREVWILNARLFGFLSDEPSSHTADVEPSAPAGVDPADSPRKKAGSSSRFSALFRSSSREGATPSADFDSSVAQQLAAAGGSGNDKFGQTQLFKDAMATSTPQQLREAFWSMVKHDHPDALLLRFLRARKWDVHAAEVMAISALHWRITEKVDSDIMLRGEAGMLDDSRDASDKKVKQLGSDFIGQFRIGKSFVKGIDKDGRPLCYIRVRKHRAGDYSEESLERYTIYTIETARMMLRPPVDTAVSYL
jgi:CRAL/TRIO, N-terminal domain/CRAL/TRIO domain